MQQPFRRVPAQFLFFALTGKKKETAGLIGPAGQDGDVTQRRRRLKQAQRRGDCPAIAHLHKTQQALAGIKAEARRCGCAKPFGHRRRCRAEF